MMKRFALSAICGALCFPALAHGLPFIPMAGFEADTHQQGFAFTGFSADQPVYGKLNLSVLGMGSYLYYRFPVGSQTIRAESPGVHYLGGLKYAAAGDNYLTVLGGGVSRKTKYLDGPITQTRADSGATILAELNLHAARRITFNALATYSENNVYRWARFTLKHQITRLDNPGPWVVHIGGVGTFQGNSQYTARQGGALIEGYHIPWALSISVQGGYKWDTSWGRGGYAGISIARPFF